MLEDYDIVHFTIRNALKSVLIQDLILSDQYLTIKFQRKSSDF